MEFRKELRRLVFLTALNLWPCIRGAGVRITHLSRDYRELRVKLPLNWRTRNRLGTIFGGSLYASVDPFYVILLMECLGRDYVVWDKAAVIRFRQPGRTTLQGAFVIEDSLLEAIRERTRLDGEWTFDLPVTLKDSKGVVHAEITKTLYVARKEFYREKLETKKRRAPSELASS